MDWKRILSSASSADKLEENEKDELLNAIAWHDFTNEKVDAKRHAALLRMCQEIMKYKSEQVDALLAELDEMAVKQAEEEAHIRESDEKSSRSRKSLDGDEQDTRFRELEAKYRKLQKVVGTSRRENEQLKQNARVLEEERVYLQRELRNANQRDDSASDISEAVKDQQRTLMESVQQKNAQISQLLTDIENVESDNLQIRARASTLRDSLADATEKLDGLVDDNKSLREQLASAQEVTLQMQATVDARQREIAELLADKEAKRLEFEKFAGDIDARIEDWKKLLAMKNEEIEQLKSSADRASAPPTPSQAGVPPADVSGNVSILNEALVEREENIIRLQKQLAIATKEMLKSAQVLKQVTKERDSYTKKCECLNALSRDLRKQLKAAHQRAQELAEEVQCHNKLMNDRDSNMAELIAKIEDANVRCLASDLERTQSEKALKEKKIAELVRRCNALRGKADAFEKENVALRDRLGLTEDDYVSTKCVSVQQRRHKKLFDELHSRLQICEEEKLQYRLEVQKLSKVIADQSDQLLEMGGTPIVADQTTTNVTRMGADEGVELKVQAASATKCEYSALLEENDALRKGLHEILLSVQTKQETSPQEIRSETLESLLRALDAKHVSGWYHPAMRLQAEVHTLQGRNTALREQLRTARMDLEALKGSASPMMTLDSTLGSSHAIAIANLNNHLVNVLKDYGADDETNVKLIEKLEAYKREFLIIQDQVGALYEQYTEEKSKWESAMLASEERLGELGTANEALQSQLHTIKLLTNPETEGEAQIREVAEATAKLVVTNRKVVCLHNAVARHKNEINKLRDELLEAQHRCATNLTQSSAAKLELLRKLDKLESASEAKCWPPEDVVRLQNNYDALLAKQRELQRTIDEASCTTNNALEAQERRVALLEREKDELVARFGSGVSELVGADELRARFAQAEMNASIERQRANHAQSLYELAREQLDKSERRHEEFRKYNGELLQKNLTLQESVKMLEDKVLFYVDGALFRAEQRERERREAECRLQAAELEALRDELKVLREDAATRALWIHSEQYECHSMRHQIVDLQATDDDKAVIARLSADVVTARMAEAEVRKKLDEAIAQLASCNAEAGLRIDRLKVDNCNFVETNEALRRKNSHLESIIKQQRSHYFGYVPYASQERIIAQIGDIADEKKRVHATLTRTERIEFDCRLIKETLDLKAEVLNELNQMIRDGDAQARAMEKWFLEKTNVQLQALRCRRQAEFKDAQLQQADARLQNQEERIAQLEAELLQTLCVWDTRKVRAAQDNTIAPAAIASKMTHLKTTPAKVLELLPDGTPHTVRTPPPAAPEATDECKQACHRLRAELEERQAEVGRQMEAQQRLEEKASDLEANTVLLRQQIADKQSQIAFYERHILEMQQSKPPEAKDARRIQQLQQTLAEKERVVFELQSLLKKDRDEHSLAAGRFQDELRALQAQRALEAEEHAAGTKLGKPARAAVEYYIQQVHALETLSAELQTAVSTLGTQLQASREECARWKALSDGRLQSVDELRLQLEEQHQAELQAYRGECEKWRSEVQTLQLHIGAYKKDIVDLRPSIEKELRQKDDRIHALTVSLRQLKAELRRKAASQPSASERSEENLPDVKESLLREQEVLRKRCERLLGREKSAREEIRSLRGQLVKRPAMSARSDTSASKEQQQARKVQALERQVSELREKLAHEAALNEAHKVRVHADFDKWSKLKHWQQTAEKARARLKEQSDECEKMQQACSGYRVLIERQEREKHNLEARLKSVKGTARHGGGGGGGGDVCSTLAAENAKQAAEMGALRAKLEQVQHHSGALSAALLQEKLEAQERKITVLEISAKGDGEVRAELERVQNANAALQKANLRLEAESLEMRLDLEKSANQVPQLREQINYLENYIKMLQTAEPEAKRETAAASDCSATAEAKRTSELERTVLALKRVVEKLQVENKRLAGGARPCASSVRGASGEYNRLKQQHDEKVGRIGSLEKELDAANQKLKARANNGSNGNLNALQEELEAVRVQLQCKAALLDKVKSLLQRAAAKEKALLDEVDSLKAIVNPK